MATTELESTLLSIAAWRRRPKKSACTRVLCISGSDVTCTNIAGRPGWLPTYELLHRNGSGFA